MKYDGHLGTRISALFVILILSSAVALFPVLAVRNGLHSVRPEEMMNHSIDLLTSPLPVF
jgi:hypothetical protein